MKVVNNDQEYEEFYPYDKKNIRKYPKEYPCCVGMSLEGGGLTGEWWDIHVAYFPKNVTTDEAFLIGLGDPWELLE